MQPRLFALALSLAAFQSLAQPAAAQDREPPVRTIALLGLGEVRAKPDIAVITIGVAKRANTAREALAQNNTAMQQIIDHLKAAGIETKDIQTSNFSVAPAYAYDNQGQQPPRIIGYDVSNQVTVIMRKLADMGAILDEAVSQGSNQIHGISFSIDKPQALQDEARRLAIADATRKAKLYAESAGVSLGQILSIHEHMEPPPVPVYAKAQRMEAADAAVPVAEGEHVVSIRVNISWEIR
jgi:uncharacterized protein YggE